MRGQVVPRAGDGRGQCVRQPTRVRPVAVGRVRGERRREARAETGAGLFVLLLRGFRPNTGGLRGARASTRLLLQPPMGSKGGGDDVAAEQ